MHVSLRPDRLYQDYTEVTPELLQKRGIKLLLCDLDYTLAPKSTPEPDQMVHSWIESLKKAGIKVIILSNNRSPKRVLTFCRSLGVEYVGRAQKPRPRTYRETMAAENATAAETAMLGDKLLTDMLGANLSGIWALMVQPKGGPVGMWNHVLYVLQIPFKAWRREK